MISKSLQTTEGDKQVGTLSPFLFNFFKDDLISENISMNIRAKLNDINISILAYCDGILLLSSNEAHMNALLRCCHIFFCKWKY